MKTKYKYIIIAVFIVVSIALAYDAFSSYVNPYLSVTDVAQNNVTYANRDVQVLGKVVNGSSGWAQDGSFHFDLTDLQSTIKVTYGVSPPANFQEGQEVVAKGTIVSPSHLDASEILVKCPSKYESGETSLLADPVFIVAIVLGSGALVYYVASVLLRKS